MKRHHYRPFTVRDGSEACAHCYAPKSHPVHYPPVFDALLNEANPVEWAAQEFRCATLYLDSLEIPYFIDNQALSLVGRIQLAMNSMKIQSSGGPGVGCGQDGREGDEPRGQEDTPAAMDASGSRTSSTLTCGEPSTRRLSLRAK
jgi:hypothetical protein